MKLRLRNNSIRFRLTQSEVARLQQEGLLEELVDFGGGEILAYRLETRALPGPPLASFRRGTVAVSVSVAEAGLWAASDAVGVYAQSGSLTISIEKDFHCVEPPGNAFPYAGEPCKGTST